MKNTTTLTLAAASILAVQANASLFDFFPDPDRPINIHHTAIDTTAHRHGFLNSVSTQKHSMVAVGVGGCLGEYGVPEDECVQKSGDTIIVAVATPQDDVPYQLPSDWIKAGEEIDDGDGGPQGDDFSGDGFSDNNTDAAGPGGIGSI